MRYTLEEIAKRINGKLFGPPDLVIEGINTPELAGKNEMCVVFDEDLISAAENGSAGAVVIRDKLSVAKPYITVEDPRSVLPCLLQLFLERRELAGIHDTVITGANCTISNNCYIGPYVVMGDNVKIGERVNIMAGARIGSNVVIGEETFIGYNVVIEDRSTIGKRVKIQHGAIIGKEGFGFQKRGDTYIRIPHLGNVVIEDDVEIGANSIVDRSTLGSTIIKKGSKIDSLVLVAHNVRIGENTVIAGQTGIAGSCLIGDRCMFGGQVGIADHVKIGDNTVIFAQSGVISDIPPNSIMSGTPARPHREWLRAQALLLRLPKILRRLGLKDVSDNSQ